MQSDAINYVEYIGNLVGRARKAQSIARDYSQERVDELCEAVSYAALDDQFRSRAAEMLVKEAGLGNVADKMLKIRNKAMGIYRDMKGVRSTGIIAEDLEKSLVTYIKPIGVIGGIIPVTNGEVMPIIEALWILKSRNAIIMSPHHSGKFTAQFVVNYIRAVLRQFGAPEDLVICIDPEAGGRACTAQMMAQCDFILATGGSSLVKAAYSSGKPAIGVGAGNATTYIDTGVDLDQVAEMLQMSQSMDNSTSCSSENNAIVDEQIYDAFISACRKKGAAVILNDSADKEKLKKAVFPDLPKSHAPSRLVAGRNAGKILEIAGIESPADPSFILVEELDGVGEGYAFTGEKVSPILTVVRARDFEDGIEKMEAILDYSGKGHSCGIHTRDDQKVAILAEKMDVARILVNQPQTQGNSGAFFNGLPITMSLGCGTWGGNSTCSNITWRDLTNTTTVSRRLNRDTAPTVDELYSDRIKGMKFEIGL